MNLPESLDEISALSRSLGCSTEVAVEVYQILRAELGEVVLPIPSAAWEWVAWGAFASYRNARLDARRSDPVYDLVVSLPEGGES